MKWPWRAKTNAEAKVDESAEAVDGPAFVTESIGKRIQARLDADWTDPTLEVRDGTGRVYPTREARAAGGAPDRIVPLDEPEAQAG
ncbi:hypothetical protein ABZY81_06795 [Streptomyces sp. NPDC006514]|uniref:hypothetical protein n=1 Tax=Streptomyces sp. NPDC006514 TaxID=3154308 RepID=UPI0033A6B887